MSALIRKLIQGAYQAGKPAVKALGGDLTNPQTYVRLASQADDVLRGMLPQSFKGTGFSKAPMSVIDQLNDAARLPVGSTVRDRAIQQTGRNFQMADRLQNMPAPRPSGATSTGALRAPSVRRTGLDDLIDSGQVKLTNKFAGTTGAPSTQLPQAGGPLARDYALGRSSGAVNEMAKVRQLLSQTPVKKAQGGLGSLGKKALKGIPVVGPAIYGGIDVTGRIQSGENPLDAVGRSLFGAVSGGISGAGGAVLYGEPGDPFSGAYAAGTIGYDTGVQAYDALKNRLGLAGSGPKQKAYKDMTPLERRALYGGSGDMDAGPDAQDLAKAQAEVDRADAADTLQGGGRGWVPPYDEPSSTIPGNDGYVSPIEPEQPTTTQLPPTAEQTVMDPYTYQLAVYGQGRNMTGTQQERNSVRDLGLAINRQMYGDVTTPKTINPLMQRTFPDRYPQTMDAVIEEKGVMLPGSMIEADSTTALVAGTTANDPYKMEAQTRAVEQLLQQAQVDALRRRYGVQ